MRNCISGIGSQHRHGLGGWQLGGGAFGELVGRERPVAVTDEPLQQRVLRLIGLQDHLPRALGPAGSAMARHLPIQPFKR